MKEAKQVKTRRCPHEIQRNHKRSFLEPSSDHRDHGDAAMNPGTSNADLLVLKSDWGEDLVDCTSTRPFLQGRANALDITIVYRTFHTGRELAYWLRKMFMARSKPRLVPELGRPESAEFPMVGVPSGAFAAGVERCRRHP
jgi:hypothetical protein